VAIVLSAFPEPISVSTGAIPNLNVGINPVQSCKGKAIKCDPSQAAFQEEGDQARSRQNFGWRSNNTINIMVGVANSSRAGLIGFGWIPPREGLDFCEQLYGYQYTAYFLWLSQCANG